MAARLLPRLHGIMAPLTTPYGSDNKVAHDKLIGNIEKMVAQTHSAGGTVPGMMRNASWSINRLFYSFCRTWHQQRDAIVDAPGATRARQAREDVAG